MCPKFKKIRYWDWRLTEHSKVDDYSQAYFPHMNKKDGLQIFIQEKGHMS